MILEGNLVRDPEANLTPKGTRVGKFSVASNRFYKSH
ncbi:single-stranded DNA-binding protein [Oceanispirochaeta sp.]